MRTTTRTSRTQLRIFSSAVMLTLGAYAGIIYSPFADSGDLPDGGVKLKISGGNNGDLYAYLSEGGVRVPVWNRIGVSSGSLLGSSGAGLDSVALSDRGSVNTDAAGKGVWNGAYKPEGQSTRALRSAALFNGSDDSILLVDPWLGCGGLVSNRTRTLFIGDLFAGAQSQERDWSLEIAALPKPANVMLGIFAGVSLVAILARTRSVRHRVHSWLIAVVRWIDAV